MPIARMWANRMGMNVLRSVALTPQITDATKRANSNANASKGQWRSSHSEKRYRNSSILDCRIVRGRPRSRPATCQVGLLGGVANARLQARQVVDDASALLRGSARRSVRAVLR